MRRLIPLILLAIVPALLHSQIIHESRRTVWSPGIKNGIPAINSPMVSIIDYGADNTGQNNSIPAIDKAIATLPESGGVVFIPEGLYLLKGTLSINRNNVVVRGEGVDKTFLLSDHKGVSVKIESKKNHLWQKIISGFHKGSRAIVVENGASFQSGDFIEIQQLNDESVMYTKKEWNTNWALNSVGQVLEVEHVNGDTIFLKSLLHISFSEKLSPLARKIEVVKYAGFEDFYIQKLVADNHTFFFSQSAYCWMKGVHSCMTMRSHVKMSASVGNEIRDCFFNKSYSYGGGGMAYGVECSFHTTDVLVENNAFDSLRHAMMVQTGASGNVFAYNYSNNTVQGEDVTKLNKGWIPPDISVHGHYPFMNLFEGNDVCEIGVADYWGPAGPGNTFFRNKVKGEGIFLYDHSHYQNLVGNTSKKLSIESSCLQTLLHSNTINGQQKLADSLLLELMPASYFLEKSPAYFEGFVWPPFGPDSSAYELPAQMIYEKRKLFYALYSPAETYVTQNKQLRQTFTVSSNQFNASILIKYIVDDYKGSSFEVYSMNGKLEKQFKIDMNEGLIEWLPVNPKGSFYIIVLKHNNGNIIAKKFIN